jgi:uncharacterized protein YceH (UPF0502 family)
MRVFARIEDGVVRELHRTEEGIAGKFHPALRWVEVTGARVEERFRETEQGFAAPVEHAAEAAAEAPGAALAALRTQLAALQARIEALAAQG